MDHWEQDPRFTREQLEKIHDSFTKDRPSVNKLAKLYVKYFKHIQKLDTDIMMADSLLDYFKTVRESNLAVNEKYFSIDIAQYGNPRYKLTEDKQKFIREHPSMLKTQIHVVKCYHVIVKTFLTKSREEFIRDLEGNRFSQLILPEETVVKSMRNTRSVLSKNTKLKPSVFQDPNLSDIIISYLLPKKGGKTRRVKKR